MHNTRRTTRKEHNNEIEQPPRQHNNRILDNTYQNVLERISEKQNKKIPGTQSAILVKRLDIMKHTGQGIENGWNEYQNKHQQLQERPNRKYYEHSRKQIGAMREHQKHRGNTRTQMEITING